MNTSGLTITTALFALLIALLGQPAKAADSMPSTSPATPSQTGTELLRGDILNIEGPMVIIKDVSGHEIQLQTDKDTKTDGVPKVGDKIEAAVTRDGRAASIRPVLPDESSPVRSVR